LQETKAFCFEIDDFEHLEVRNIIDLIDTDTGAGYGSGCDWARRATILAGVVS